MKEIVTYFLDRMRETYSFNDISFDSTFIIYGKHVINTLSINQQISCKQYYLLPSPFGEGLGVRLVGLLVEGFFFPILFA